MKNIFSNKEYRKILIPLLLLPVWYLIYHFLQPLTDWLIYGLLCMEKGTQFTESIRFFVFEFPKVLMLLTLIIFFVGIIRSYFSPERTRKILEGKTQFTGNILASLLGIVTPFCSCSAIIWFVWLENSFNICRNRFGNCNYSRLDNRQVKARKMGGRLGI